MLRLEKGAKKERRLCSPSDLTEGESQADFPVLDKAERARQPGGERREKLGSRLGKEREQKAKPWVRVSNL